jgi:hypothetical protein
MKTPSKPHLRSEFERPAKDAVLRARCSKSLVARVYRMAALNEKDASDIIRDAVLARVSEFEQKIKAA